MKTIFALCVVLMIAACTAKTELVPSATTATVLEPWQPYDEDFRGCEGG